MTYNPKDLTRYTPRERTNHWMVAICFILIALSGLTFFHPLFWPFSELFGGGVWTRILHPFIGLLMAFCFALLFLQFRSFMHMTPNDWEWLKHADELIKGNEYKMPPQGKYNAGQKIQFWSAAVCIVLMLFSGVIMWR